MSTTADAGPWKVNDIHYRTLNPVDNTEYSNLGQGQGNLTDAWTAGSLFGSAAQTTVERMTYATDTSTPLLRSGWPMKNRGTDAVSNTTDGWFMGGYDPDNLLAISRIYRINYATDTQGALIRGNMDRTKIYVACVNNESYGWAIGADYGSSGTLTGSLSTSSMNRMTYATDTSTATGRVGFYIKDATGTSNATDGWFGGGVLVPGFPGNQDGPQRSTVVRVIFSNDTANPVTKGPLTQARNLLTACGNSTDGWFAGGGTPSSNPTSRVERVVFSNDTATAVSKGPLVLARQQLSSTSNTTDGWFIGGSGPGVSVTDRVSFSNDTPMATQKANPALGRQNHATT